GNLGASSLRSFAGVARAGADQRAALILLDRMRDPADGAPDDKQPEPGAARKPQSGGGGGEGKIDIRVLAAETAPGSCRQLDRRIGVGDGALERREDGHGTRIARRIEELAKSGE